MRAVLPKPPSVGTLWRMTSKPFPRMYMTARGKAWFEEAGWIWKEAKGRRKTIKGEVELEIDLYYCRPIDLDNVLKCALDSLTKAGVIEDDRQVAGINIHRYKVKHMKEEKLEVEVFEV